MRIGATCENFRPAGHTAGVDRAVIVTAALLRAGRLLLGHRSPRRLRYPDVWDLPGGHVEPGETPEQALVREMAEELGIGIARPTTPPVAVLEAVGFVMSVWTVESWTGSPVNAAPEEHDELRWVGPAEALGLTLAHAAYPALLTEIFQLKGISPERS